MSLKELLKKIDFKKDYLVISSNMTGAITGAFWLYDSGLEEKTYSGIIAGLLTIVCSNITGYYLWKRDTDKLEVQITIENIIEDDSINRTN